MNHTITVIQKLTSRVARVTIDLDKWEQLANVFGFYNPAFLKPPKIFSRIQTRKNPEDKIS